MNEDFRIRQAGMADMETIVEWAAGEGWNPGLDDSVPFYAADPYGFFVGELNGKVISSISAVAYGEDYGFVGFYMVLPEYRGRGFGYQTWLRGLEHLLGRNIGLDGVVAQQNNYRKSGFVFKHNNIRYSGMSANSDFYETKARTIIDADFDKLAEYDSGIFGVDRRNFLKAWMSMRESKSFLCSEDERITGYVTARKCRYGYKIGPLFAEDVETAKTLINTSLGSIPENTEFFLDIPDVNPNRIDLIRDYSLAPVFETARMYTKEGPHMDTLRCFGVTTFELG